MSEIDIPERKKNDQLLKILRSIDKKINTVQNGLYLIFAALITVGVISFVILRVIMTV